jgi:cysteine-rich repeat protein
LNDDDGCDRNCTFTGCGNGIMTGSEMCDDGNETDGDGCDITCRYTGCHSGRLTGDELCDDGNENNDDACVDSCVPARCGDAYVRVGNEECDDGNAITEECEYDDAECMVCGSECRNVPGLTSGCGDGVRQSAREKCDDGNVACGTCSPDCQTVLASAQSRGLIYVTGPEKLESNRLTIWDGVTRPVKIEFDVNNVLLDAPAPGSNYDYLVIKFGTVNDNGEVQFDSPSMIREKVFSAFVKIKLDRAAVSSKFFILPLRQQNDVRGVKLTHELLTGVGNQEIAYVSPDGNGGLIVTGMEGGAGGDCATGTACRSDLDCISNSCKQNSCE